MSRAEKRTVILVGFAISYLLLLWLDEMFARVPFALAPPPPSVHYVWAYNIGQSLAHYIIIPLMALGGWPLGVWLWRKARVACYLGAALSFLVSAATIAAYLSSWFLA